jgi:uncharacterized protein (DUF433 family)
VEVPLYTPLDVVRYLRAPVWLAFTLSGRDHFPPPEWFFHGLWRDPAGPFLEDDDLLDTSGMLPRERIPFVRMADLFVRTAALEGLADLARKKPRSRGWWVDCSEALWRALSDRRLPEFPGPREQQAASVDRFLEPFARSLTDSERTWLRKLLLQRLDRVELQENVAVRFYPTTRPPRQEAPRVVVLDPRIRFGRPTVAGHGTPTDSLFERHQAGDSIRLLAEDYGLSPEAVEEALRYEAAAPVRLPFFFPFFDW